VRLLGEESDSVSHLSDHVHAKCDTWAPAL
jgi:hypothetical protein